MAISYAEFQTARPEAYRVLKAYDERAEHEGDLPHTPGVFTKADVAAVQARDPQAVALISATVQSTALGMLNEALKPVAVKPPVAAPSSVADRLVSETIRQARAGGSLKSRDRVLAKFADRYSASLDSAQLIQLANAAYYSSSKKYMAVTFTAKNAAKLSTTEAIALGKAAGGVSGRDAVLMGFACKNTHRLHRADLTTLANAAYYSSTKSALVELEVNP